MRSITMVTSTFTQPRPPWPPRCHVRVARDYRPAGLLAGCLALVPGGPHISATHPRKPRSDCGAGPDEDARIGRIEHSCEEASLHLFRSGLRQLVHELDVVRQVGSLERGRSNRLAASNEWRSLTITATTTSLSPGAPVRDGTPYTWASRTSGCSSTVRRTNPSEMNSPIRRMPPSSLR